MPGVTKEQIAQSKRIDLLTYLKYYEPDAITRSGPHEYRLKEHDSLVISNGKWHWCSRGIGGATALDFLIHVRGMAFVDAVQTILDGRAAPIVPSQPVPPKVRKPFALPTENRCGFHAVAYLQKRGIDSDIIRRCMSEGRFYEGRKYHNCVFVGYDPENKPRFACVRSISSGFRQDIEGSDKRYGFVLPSCDPASRSVAVFESPIDALSLATLRKRQTDKLDDYSYLSLGGTSPLALIQYLKDHPHVNQVSLCVDNDKAGLEATHGIRKAIYQDEELFDRIHMITHDPPPIGKDYNDTLLSTLQMQKQQSAPSRQEAAISM